MGMVSKGTCTEPSGFDPLDEKTPTSIYLPRFDSSIQMRADPPSAVTQRDSWPLPRSAVCEQGGVEPSIIIAAELAGDSWCDTVADTVAIVRRRRPNAAALVVIAVLSGLLVVAAGILLAELGLGRCSISTTCHPQGTVNGQSLSRMQQRLNIAQP